MLPKTSSTIEAELYNIEVIGTEKRTRYNAANLLPEPQLDAARWSRVPAEKDIASSVKEIEARGVKVLQVQDGREALARIEELIPPGAEVMNGSSTTLIESGYLDLLKSEQRIREYAYPLEDARSKKVYGTASQIGKCVILSNERQQGRVTLILS